MGVTNRSEVHYKNPEQMSSTESLHIPLSRSQSSLASAVSTDEVQHLPLRRQRRSHKNPVDFPMSSPRNCGRRRQRRYKAVTELEALIEEEEPEVFLGEGIPHKSLFTTVTDDPELEKIWDEYVLKDEAQSSEHTNPKPNTVCYNNISLNVKKTFKMMRDFCELDRMETELLTFFTNSPDNIYTSSTKSSFQRLLIHGIAQYYCFKSTSFDGEDAKRTIKVVNANNSRAFCEKRLFNIVEDNRKKYL